ncbi:MAG: hypothetical protein FJ100_15855 [Deltaproteobacteria bacterium]|nr:hypothetical protein [Deltaproteobacteria bacterium]
MTPRCLLPYLAALLVLPPRPSAAGEPPPAPCAVADVATQAVRAALARAVRPMTWQPPPPRSAWWLLVPATVGLGLHDGVHAGTGWTDTLSGGSGRWSQFDSQWARLTLSWDLRPLAVNPSSKPPPDAAQRLEPMIKIESVAVRAADALRALRKAQALAASTTAGDPMCKDAQAEAEAAALVLDALVAASP